jgi:hypothetical protein
MRRLPLQARVHARNGGFRGGPVNGELGRATLRIVNATAQKTLDALGRVLLAIATCGYSEFCVPVRDGRRPVPKDHTPIVLPAKSAGFEH